MNDSTVPPAAAELWSRFRAHVDARRSRGEICLLPMVLLGFPDRPRQLDYVEILTSHGVSLAEIVEPVAEGWAPTTNTTIRSAHETALRHALPEDGPAVATRFAGTLKVVYRGNIPVNPAGLESVFAASVGVYSILQLAFPPDTVTERLDALSAPITTLVSAGDSERQLEQAARSARWMLVCKIADATGGILYDPDRIRGALEVIRSASRLPLFCTFGIGEPGTVERLRMLRTCDGVIVGTAILERLISGAEPVRSLMGDLCRAAFD